MALTDATRLANFGSGIGTDSTLDILNVNATGIVTAATLKVGSAVTVSGGIITATTGAFSGDVSVRNLTGVAATFTGVLTYDDVTNVDSVGIITAKAGLNVVGGGATVTGVSTFFSDVSIADKIIHTGDTNTAIRFPAADTFTVETGGSERVRVTSAGLFGVGTNNPQLKFVVSNNNALGFEVDPSQSSGTILGINAFDRNASAFKPLRLNAEDHRFDTSSTERLRIDSSGRLLQGKTATKGSTGENVPTYCNEITSNNPNVLEIANNGTGNSSYSALVLSRSDGTSVNSHTAVDSGDKIGEVCFIGADGADRFNTAASIHVEAGADFTANDCPANLILSTNAGAASATERLRITSGGGFHFTNGELIERAKVTAGKLSDNTNIDLENGMVHLFTTQETTTSTPNIRINSSTSLNSVMATGEMISVTLITTAAAGAYSAQLTIDGNAVTENWTGGSAPSGGGSSGVDIHAYTIIKTADATFTVVATQTKTS